MEFQQDSCLSSPFSGLPHAAVWKICADISLLRYAAEGAIVTLNKLDRVLSLICPNLLKQD